MRRFVFCMIAAMALALVRPVPAQAQDVQQPSALRVFLDCDRGCDTNYLRTEITFVEWVRDRTDSDVHLLVTSQRAGSGTEYTLSYIGMGTFAASDDTLTFITSQTDTEDEVRERMAQVMTVGLLRYVLETPSAERIRVSLESGIRPATAVPSEDPWNYWIFQVRLNGSLQGELSSKGSSIDGSVSARRVTENWKTEFSTSGRYSESWFELGSGRKITNYTHLLSAIGLVAKSVSDHWSAGVIGELGSSTHLNVHSFSRLAPVVEFSVFPYSEFTRRQFTVRYSLGINSVEYEEETIFGQMAESRSDEELQVLYEVTQPWGSARVSVSGAHYFHDLNRYHLDASTSWNIRIFRGFSLNLSGNVSEIHDQLYLAHRGATDEEILLRIRRLATSYDYSVRIGFSYTFGSIYSTVVNPRLSGSRHYQR